MKKAFFVIMAAVLLFSCGKEGPQGMNGRDGRDGRNGQDGRDGRDGAQINTYYFEVSPSDWKAFGTFGTQGYYCYDEKDFNALTATVIDKGGILVYVLLDGYDYQLPHLMHYFDNGVLYTRLIRYDLKEGKIGFVVEDSNFKIPLPPFTNGVVQFKVVVIS